MNGRIDLVAGQNCLLSSTGLHVLVNPGSLPPGMTLDSSAFLLDGQSKVTGDDDFIFFNQPATANRDVLWEPELNRFTLHLEKTEAKFQKIALTITISGGHQKGQNFSQVNNGITVLLKDFLTGLEIACFVVNTSDKKESALILGEFYRHQGNWKFRAVGQGFVGGLQPLAEHFGVDVGEGEGGDETPAAPPAPKVNLTKITLEKKGQSISLEKQGDNGIGEILINLNWNATPVKPTGPFSRPSTGIDLDLGCLWEFNQGAKGATQALGDHFGNLHQFPFVELDQDDRSGQSIGGETLRINGRYWHEFRRILVYTFIYEGVPNWSHVDAVITIKSNGQPDIEVRLDSYRNDQFLCAIAILENINNQVRITKLVDYFSGHQQMDRAYGWGLNYVAGSK